MLHIKLIEYLCSFTPLPDALIGDLRKRMIVKRIAKGTTYFEKNTYSRKLGFITEGIMRIYDIDKSGHQWNKVFLPAPNLVLGNPNLEEKSAHFVETITSCEVNEIPIDLVNEYTIKYPEMRELHRKILLHLFEKKSKRELDFLTLTAKERYLNYLKEYNHVINEIPQFHIASYLGITTTQLSRINISLKKSTNVNDIERFNY